METDAVFFFNGPIDEDQAVFDAYSALKQNMLNDTYVALVPTVVLVVYISPDPLPSPPSNGSGGGNENGSEDPIDTVRSTNSNPWVIGAVAGVALFGGVILMYKLRRDKRRHSSVPLEDEETSNSNGSQGGGADNGGDGRPEDTGDAA